ncbi:hypothetical protein HY933_00930 [Candidatus Falkowbacteria bacterium]|nr:hypothetical protein [Candidatus Falkowbacteria bacterium]
MNHEYPYEGTNPDFGGRGGIPESSDEAIVFQSPEAVLDALNETEEAFFDPNSPDKDNTMGNIFALEEIAKVLVELAARLGEEVAPEIMPALDRLMKAVRQPTPQRNEAAIRADLETVREALKAALPL